MIKFLIILAIGAVLGGLMGYYGKCTSGKCPLTANPWRGAVWGMCLAAFAAYPVLANALRKPTVESQNIQKIDNAENLSNKIQKKGSIYLLDFYADWCGPCRTLSPTINRLADEYKGKVNVVKVNIDNYKELAQKYRANSIPTVIILKDGVEVDRVVGARKFENYSKILDKL